MRFLLAGLRQVFDVVEFVVLITLKRVKLQLNIPQDTLHLCCTKCLCTMYLYNTCITVADPDPPRFFLFLCLMARCHSFYFIYFYIIRADIQYFFIYTTHRAPPLLSSLLSAWKRASSTKICLDLSCWIRI
jgi:hypothetical protein